MRLGLGRKWRLTLLLTGTLCVAVMAQARAQGHDGRWWEAIPGFGQQERQPRRTSDEEPRRRSEAPEDLRPDRADAQRHHDRSARGGNPALPANRLQRRLAGDTGLADGPARRRRRAHAAVRQRLMISGELPRGRGPVAWFGDDGTSRPQCAASRYNKGCASPAASTSRRCRPSTCRRKRASPSCGLNLQRLRDLMAQRIEDRYILVNAASLPAGGGGAPSGRAAAPRHRRQARAADADACAPPSRRSISSPIGACPRASPRSI